MTIVKNIMEKPSFFKLDFEETLAQMFSCEFCEISKNTYFYRRPPVAASVHSLLLFPNWILFGARQECPSYGASLCNYLLYRK